MCVQTGFSFAAKVFASKKSTAPAASWPVEEKLDRQAISVVKTSVAATL